MILKVTSFFKNSKDKRIKFNFHIGSFFILNVVILSLLYIYAKIALDVFGISIFYHFIFTYYIFIISCIISYIFSSRAYYWYYQRDLINEVFSYDVQNDVIIYTNKDKLERILIIAYKIFPYFLMSSFLLITLLHKNILDQIDFSIIFISNLLFQIYLVKNLIKKFNYINFKKIKYEGIMTNYSEGVAL